MTDLRIFQTYISSGAAGFHGSFALLQLSERCDVTPRVLSPCQSCVLAEACERQVTARRELWLRLHLQEPQNLPLLAPACRQPLQKQLPALMLA